MAKLRFSQKKNGVIKSYHQFYGRPILFVRVNPCVYNQHKSFPCTQSEEVEVSNKFLASIEHLSPDNIYVCIFSLNNLVLNAVDTCKREDSLLYHCRFRLLEKEVFSEQ